MIHFYALKKYVLAELSEKLPANLYYHRMLHTVDVLHSAERIGKHYNLVSGDYLLLQTAALTHETGMMFDIHNHEDASISYIKRLLPDYGYSSQQIESISQIILSTKMPQNPQSLLDEILCDADLDYLGRSDFFIISQLLRQEWIEIMAYPTSLKHWFKGQISFLGTHQYFTSFSKDSRDEIKFNNLQLIKDLLNQSNKKCC